MKKAPRAKNRTVEISKTLSFILRHGATKEGLNITSDGYVSVKELLAWKGLTDL
jgi:2'-phosphotransferase